MVAVLPFEHTNRSVRESASNLPPTTLITSSASLNPNLSNIPILSFFTGAGFLDLGFAQAGFNVCWRNEYNPAFVKGFEYGMSQLTGHSNDYKIHNISSIEALEAKKIAEEAFHNTPRPEMFGIIGGPPCPDFSKGGKNKGKDGDNGKLSQVFVDRIISLEPTFFLFENVPGLKRTVKHREFLSELLAQLTQKYHVELSILNSLDFGVPQDRERIFIIGFLRSWLRRERDIRVVPTEQQYLKELSKKIKNNNEVLTFGEPHWFPWPIDPYYLGSKNRYTWPSAVANFDDIPEMPLNIPTELMVGSLICDQSYLQTLPNGTEAFEPKSEKFEEIREGDVSGKSFKRLHRWRYSPSVAYGNNEIHLHPTEKRRLTVREALRIQSVPDKYALPDELKLTQKFKTISNGVPVKLARAVGLSFAAVLGNNRT